MLRLIFSLATLFTATAAAVGAWRAEWGEVVHAGGVFIILVGAGIAACLVLLGIARVIEATKERPSHHIEVQKGTYDQRTQVMLVSPDGRQLQPMGQNATTLQQAGWRVVEVR